MRDYGTYVITFTDGTEESIYANRDRVENGVLTIWSENYGARDFRHFPLVNIKAWKKVDR